MSLEKTLILSNGEYKKYSTGSIITSTTTSVPKMTSNTVPNGVASASSVLSSYDAWKAFDQIETHSGSWINNGTMPSWLSYKFDVPIVIAKISIKNRADGSLSEQSPKDFAFQAYDETSGKWIDLLVINNTPSWGNAEVRTYEFFNIKQYREYRLHITTAQSGNYITISELKMFSVTSLTNRGWSTVSSTLPTSTQFIEQGMNSLSPLLERKVTMLEPQAMTQDTTWTEGGKVFKKSIDLKKYFDIRSINITN